MRKLSVAGWILFACFLSSTAGAQNNVCTSVHLGGADVNWDTESAPPNNDANLSLGAIEKCNGTVRGQLQDTWAGLGGVHGTVSCIVVDGNNAWASGIITHAPVEGIEGLGFYIQLQDNGQNHGEDPPDMASFIYLGDPGDFEFLCYEMIPVDLYPLNNGQLTIN